MKVRTLMLSGAAFGMLSLHAAVPEPENAALLNGWLRKEMTWAKSWDLGGSVRAQYDVKENAGSFPDSAPDRDFIRTGQDNDNALMLLREKVHVGYRYEWLSLYVEARDSSTSGDDRDPNPFADRFDLRQAYLQLAIRF